MGTLGDQTNGRWLQSNAKPYVHISLGDARHLVGYGAAKVYYGSFPGQNRWALA